MYEKPQYLTPDGYRRRATPVGKKDVKKSTGSGAKKNMALAKSRLKKVSAQNRPISKEAAKLIAKSLGSKRTIVRSGETGLPDISFDNSLLNNELGVRDRIPFSEGIAETCRWACGLAREKH